MIEFPKNHVKSIDRKKVGPYLIPSFMLTCFFSFFISSTCSFVRPMNSLPESFVFFSFRSSARTSPSTSFDDGIVCLNAVLSRTRAKRYIRTKAIAGGKKYVSWRMMYSIAMLVFKI